jgi:hypothetical protein
MMLWNNRKERAVTVTHKPTGVAATVDCDRSQHRNRIKAMALLRARLYAQRELGARPVMGDHPVRVYRLPDDVGPYPNDLMEYAR